MKSVYVKYSTYALKYSMNFITRTTLFCCHNMQWQFTTCSYVLQLSPIANKKRYERKLFLYRLAGHKWIIFGIIIQPWNSKFKFPLLFSLLCLFSFVVNGNTFGAKARNIFIAVANSPSASQFFNLLSIQRNAFLLVTYI